LALLVVIDTNVLVSGLINPDGTPARVLDLLLANVIQAAFDDRVLAEYEEVLTRKPFSFNRKHVQALLDHVRLNGTLVSAPPMPPGDYPDRTDLPFAEVALAAGAAALVTGNPAHFSFLATFGVAVLSPQEFLGKF
jgi:putative PIN family toxin of toxin-antitoxin system